MRRYEQPGQEAIRLENLTTFSIGPRNTTASEAPQLALTTGLMDRHQAASAPENSMPSRRMNVTSAAIMPVAAIMHSAAIMPDRALQPWEVDTVPNSPCLLSANQDQLSPNPEQQLQIAAELPPVTRRRLPFTNQTVEHQPTSRVPQGSVTIDLRNNTGTVTLQLGSQAKPVFLG